MDAGKGRVVVNRHRVPVADSRVQAQDKLVLAAVRHAPVVRRAVAQVANRQVVQVVVLLYRLERNTVPVGAVVDGHNRD